VDGTAALQADRAVAEPLGVIDLDRAPRLQVAPPAPISVPRAPFVAGVIALVIAGVIGILLINTKTNENAFRIADLQKQGTTLDNQSQDLDNQLATASSPGSLDAAAKRLGLVKADNPAVIRLPDGKLIGVLTPAVGKPAVTAQNGAGSQTDEDKGAANIVPDSPGATQPGLTPNGTGTAGTGTTGTGTTANGTGGNGTTGTGTAANGTGGNGTTGNGATGNGAAGDGTGTNGTTGGTAVGGAGTNGTGSGTGADGAVTGAAGTGAGVNPGVSGNSAGTAAGAAGAGR
jgi:hypothetical protein